MINFDPVQANIYVGSAPNAQEDIAQLKQLKVSALICLQSDEDLLRRNIDWQELQQWYKAADIATRRFSIEDFNEEDLAKSVGPAIAALDEFIKAGKSVYVHCNSGIFRAPTAVLGYLCAIEGMTIDTAIQQLRIARPVVSPSKEAVRRLLNEP